MKSFQALLALVVTFLFSIDVSLAADPGWKPKVGNRMVLKRPPEVGDSRFDTLLEKAHDAAERCDTDEFERQARAVKNLMVELKPNLAADNYIDELRTEIEVCQEDLKFGNYIFQIRFDAAGAKDMEEKALKAARDCDEPTYMEQIRLAERYARAYEGKAERFREQAGEHRRSQQFDEAEEA